MSLRETALSVFPPPVILSMPAAGVDISQGSVKCVFLTEGRSGMELQSYTETALAPGIVVEGDINSRDKIIEVLRSYRLRLGIKYANACLPERKAYLYQTVLPGSSESAVDLRRAVEFDFEAHVPLPPNEAIFDFEPIRRIESGLVVGVTAYAKRMVNDYASVFGSAGILLRGLEVESQALARAVLRPEDSARTVMVIDFGKNTTRIAIADGGVVSFTATLDVGGNALTSAVMKQFNVEEAEAERIKNDGGFLMNTGNKNLVETLMTTTSVLKDEVAKQLAYWNSSGDGSLPRRAVDRVIACGGNANLRGFPEYLEGFLNVPVAVANVWSNAFSLDEYVPSMMFPESLEYATAIGLAIRGSRKYQW
jgi:type IV pilus assembly protein PilM